MGEFIKWPYDVLIRLDPHPTYKDLLGTIEWANCRMKVLNRDRRCVRCQVIVEGDETGFYRKLTAEEVAEQEREWQNWKGIDLAGDGQHFIKGQKPVVVGVQVVMQVHHLYYIQDKLPWEYDESALISVCRDCHVKIHAEEEIRMYTDASLSAFMEITPCSVCEGTGYRPEYDYYMNGVCFWCNGRGSNEELISWAAK